MKSFSTPLRMITFLFVFFWSIHANGAERLPVFVSIVPQKYFLEKIGGDVLDVSVMVLPGANPATYEPKPHQMVALSKAKLYFAIGVPFEKTWLKKFKAANPHLLVVFTEKGIKKRAMKGRHQHQQGRHEPDERHHGIKDPHIWLSPPLVKIQARNILRALIKVDRGHVALYKANYKKFIHEIEALDAEIRGILVGRVELKT